MRSWRAFEIESGTWDDGFGGNLRPMPQSLAQVYLHVVFSTKGRVDWISEKCASDLYSYLAATGDALGCPVLEVGGMPDHVHLLLRLGRGVTMSELIQGLKIESSKWMKKKGGEPEFAWQAGFGIFSVSASHVEKVKNYILNQVEHHRETSFQDEFRSLLKRYHVNYDEAYVWD